jgi:hypothetical protein
LLPLICVIVAGRSVGAGCAIRLVRWLHRQRRLTNRLFPIGGLL